MKYLCLAVAALGLTGCSLVTGRHAADGALTVTSVRWLWKSEAIAFSVRGQTTNGQPFTATLTVGKSLTDREAVEAIAIGVAKGLKGI